MGGFLEGIFPVDRWVAIIFPKYQIMIKKYLALSKNFHTENCIV